MAINELIAQGIRPIGADLPEIGNMLNQKRRADVQNALLQKQVGWQDQEHQQAQSDRLAEQGLAQLQWAVGQPKDSVAQSVPQIVQGYEQVHGAGSWAAATDDEVSGMVRNGIAHLSSQLRKAPPQAGPKNFQQWDPEKDVYEVGPNGPKLIQKGQPKAEKPPQETWHSPVDEVVGGKNSRVQYSNLGNRRVVEGAVPYERPDRAAPVNPSTSRREVANLRKEFDGLPEVKNYNLVIPTYERAVSAPNTRAGDLSIVYALGKIFDPGSVVREGELEMSKDAQPWLRKLVSGAQSQIKGTGALSSEVRQEIIAAMRGQVDSLETQYNQRRDQYSSYASEYGTDAFNVVGAHPRKRPAVTTAPAVGTTPPSVPATNSRGWTLHTDAKGNRAYVSPDGKQFEEVR